MRKRTGNPIRIILVTAFVCLLGVSSLQAQDYPKGPVQIVIPMRNVGDEGCRITQLSFDVPGVKILEGLSVGDLFPAQQTEEPLSESLGVQPFRVRGLR